MIHQQMEYIYTIYEFGSIRQAAISALMLSSI